MLDYDGWVSFLWAKKWSSNCYSKFSTVPHCFWLNSKFLCYNNRILDCYRSMAVKATSNCLRKAYYVYYPTYITLLSLSIKWKPKKLQAGKKPMPWDTPYRLPFSEAVSPFLFYAVLPASIVPRRLWFCLLALMMVSQSQTTYVAGWLARCIPKDIIKSTTGREKEREGASRHCMSAQYIVPTSYNEHCSTGLPG